MQHLLVKYYLVTGVDTLENKGRCSEVISNVSLTEGVFNLKNSGRCSSEKVSSGVDTLRNEDRCSERK